MQFSKVKPYLLIALLVIGAQLRFYQIGQPFVDATGWRQTDVASVADNIYRGNWNIFYPEVSWNGPGPSYQGMEFQTISYISALLYHLLGHQYDWIGRSVAILFGLWGIFAFYNLVRRVWDEDRALASAMFLTLMPGSIYIDRSFIPDPVMLSLVITGFWFLVTYLQTERFVFLCLAVVMSAWGFLTKLPGLIVGIPMIYAIFAILGYQKLRRPKKLWTITIAAALTLIPVVAYYLWARHLSLTYPPYHFTGSGNWLWDNGLQEWLKQGYFLPKLYQHLRVWFWGHAILALVIAGLFFPPPRRRNTAPTTSENHKAPWLFHWWILAMLIYYLIGAQQLVNNPTNLNIINPAAAALAGNALITLASSIKRVAGKTISIAAITVLFLLAGSFGYKPVTAWAYTSYGEQAFRLGVALQQASQPEDLVVTISSNFCDPIAIYYSHRRGWVFPPASVWSTTYWQDEIEDEEAAIQLLEALRAEGADWFGIVRKHQETIWRQNPKFVAYIEKTMEQYQESPEWVIYRLPSQEKANIRSGASQ